jgi:mannose-6-phosphate isomerase-like protein (cupin superfamily)
MAVMLAGGCRVSGMNEGSATASGSLKIWSQVSRVTGAKAISMRVLEFGRGRSPLLKNDQADEVLYFLENIAESERWSDYCTITIDQESFAVNSQTGVYINPGQSFSVENPTDKPVVFVSCQCPVIDESLVSDELRVPPIIRLTDRAALPTADRWYRVLVDDEVGSRQVTQFVGSIPPGRAPDHFHHYEEVLFILKGTGRMWADQMHTEIGPGSCVYLPKGQVHCVENTGTSELRLLGVFYPAGSPAVRYEA